MELASSAHAGLDAVALAETTGFGHCTFSRIPSAAERSLGDRDTPELRKAFTDFVGQTFFGELLKQMRATVEKPAYFHGGPAEDIFQTQLDQILVERITDASAATFSEPMYRLLMAQRA